jgi:hypothetical protein
VSGYRARHAAPDGVSEARQQFLAETGQAGQRTGGIQYREWLRRGWRDRQDQAPGPQSPRRLPDPLRNEPLAAPLAAPLDPLPEPAPAARKVLENLARTYMGTGVPPEADGLIREFPTLAARHEAWTAFRDATVRADALERNPEIWPSFYDADDLGDSDPSQAARALAFDAADHTYAVLTGSK